MIIQCTNCNKKFEVSSTLIPKIGRNIQCGSCNHTWFYNPGSIIDDTNLSDTNYESNISKISIIEKVQTNYNKEKNLNKGDIIINHDSTNNTGLVDQQKPKKKSNFGIGRILSYIVVGIITFIALIIILDTFESPLSNKFPTLELILYNLFETIKDIFLFLKNLLV